MKKLISTILLGLVLSMTSSLPLMAQSTTPTETPPKILGFIQEKGCRGAFDLYIFLDNNKIVHIDETNTPGRRSLKKLLGETKGFSRQFDCGITA